jgi:hypothetical protein
MYDRLLPPGGCYMTGVHYIDIHDIPEKESNKVKYYFEHDPCQIVLNKIGGYIPKGKRMSRQYCVRVKKNDSNICSIVLMEFLDNPDGYSNNDFYYFKLVRKEYIHTKYSRYAIADLLHIIFMSGMGNNLYCYVPVKNNSEFFMDAINRDMLTCASPRFESDGINVQKYILIKKRFNVLSYPYILIEINGDIYKNMDLKKYMMAVPGRSENKIEQWLSEMNKAAQQVRDFQSTL